MQSIVERILIANAIQRSYMDVQRLYLKDPDSTIEIAKRLLESFLRDPKTFLVDYGFVRLFRLIILPTVAGVGLAYVVNMITVPKTMASAAMYAGLAVALVMTLRGTLGKSTRMSWKEKLGVWLLGVFVLLVVVAGGLLFLMQHPNAK